MRPRRCPPTGEQLAARARASRPQRDRPACGATRSRNILRQRSAVVGLIILGLLVLVAVFADLIATHDPTQSLLGVEPGVQARAAPCIHLLGCPADQPSTILGTDGNFRDVFSRVVYGARTSLVVGLAAIGFAIVVGIDHRRARRLLSAAGRTTSSCASWTCSWPSRRCSSRSRS